MRDGLTLGAGQTVAIDARLETGALTDTVTITAEAPILKTESAALSNNFARDKFENLPVNRNVTNILRVVPGVVPNPSGFSNGLAEPVPEQHHSGHAR